MESSQVPRMVGVATLGAAIALAAIIALNPESLRAPGWIAYLACFSLGSGGAAAIARSYGRNRLADVLVCFLLAAFAVAGYWIAFGPGPRTCSVSTAGFSSAGGAIACRTAFGVGAAVVTLMLLMALRALLRTRGKG